jgi:hypothetical protein
MPNTAVDWCGPPEVARELDDAIVALGGGDMGGDDGDLRAHHPRSRGSGATFLITHLVASYQA